MLPVPRTDFDDLSDDELMDMDLGEDEDLVGATGFLKSLDSRSLSRWVSA